MNAQSIRITGKLSLCIALLCTLGNSAHAQLGTIGGPGFIVFGRVYLPSGKPASRVKVVLEMATGLTRDTLCDDGGNYEFRAVTAGRYNVKAINDADPQQYSDPARSDSTRAYSNRVQIDVYLRLPMHSQKEAKPGTVNVAEARQEIPKTARQAYEQGLKSQKENKTDRALAQFNQAIEIYPEYFQALTERANLRMQQNQMAEAEVDFDRAIQLNGKYPPALRGLGYCQIQQKKFAEALGNLEKSYSLEPNIPLTLLLLGYANLSLDRYEEARLALQQALKLGPESAARAHVYLAEVFVHEEKFKEAADAVRAYLKLKPDAADAAHLKELEAKWRARAKQPPNKF